MKSCCAAAHVRGTAATPSVIVADVSSTWTLKNRTPDRPRPRALQRAPMSRQRYIAALYAAASVVPHGPPLSLGARGNAKSRAFCCAQSAACSTFRPRLAVFLTTRSQQVIERLLQPTTPTLCSLCLLWHVPRPVILPRVLPLPRPPRPPIEACSPAPPEASPHLPYIGTRPAIANSLEPSSTTHPGAARRVLHPPHFIRPNSPAGHTSFTCAAAVPGRLAREQVALPTTRSQPAKPCRHHPRQPPRFPPIIITLTIKHTSPTSPMASS